MGIIEFGAVSLGLVSFFRPSQRQIRMVVAFFLCLNWSYVFCKECLVGM